MYVCAIAVCNNGVATVHSYVIKYTQNIIVS